MTTVEVHPFSVSASGFGKMEDRKRPATHDNEEAAPPSKRQATTVVNGSSRHHQDADLPQKDELEKFQKEAILRQMQEYKREKATLEAQFNDLKRRTTHHDDHLRRIDTWFSQLLDEIRISMGKVDSGSQHSSFPTQLLSSDDQTFDKYLQSRSQNISAAIEKIFIVGGDASDKTVELQGKLTELLAKEKDQLNRLEKLQIEKDQLEERLETASMRYMMAEKKLDRAKSMTVAKLERQATAGGRGETGNGHSGGQEGAKSDSANAQFDSEALAEAETAKSAALAVSAKQAEQIEALASENEKLTSQLTALKSKGSTFSDEDYANTELFKQFKIQYEDVVKKLNHVESTNADLLQETTKHQAERSTTYRMQLDAELQAVISDKDMQLSKIESDLARIRTARDELHAELTIRKSTMDQERDSVKQIKELLQARDERIQAYELEVDRLKSSTAAVAEDTPRDDGQGVEELRTKHAQLERQYAMLNQELGSMSDAYKKLSTANAVKLTAVTELEEKTLRLNAEKAKADQKYFAAMKAKESKDNEVRTLRAQNSKSSDIVSQLKDVEASTKALIVKLEKQLVESSDTVSTLQTKYRDVQSQLEQKKIQADASRKQTEELRVSITSKETACAAANAAHRKAELQVEELKVEVEDKNKRIETWKAKGLGGENEHYEALRSLAICTVCRRNFKDTALKPCGHVFCPQCIEDRISNRMRKCPNCNKAFGANDTLKITL